MSLSNYLPVVVFSQTAVDIPQTLIFGVFQLSFDFCPTWIPFRRLVAQLLPKERDEFFSYLECEGGAQQRGDKWKKKKNRVSMECGETLDLWQRLNS